VTHVTIIGGGLAGCEAAWQLAKRGIDVYLYEMRPQVQTGAHSGGDLAELVCSNSLGSILPNKASGILFNELKMLGSLLMECAQKAALPAGGALAVDRKVFSENVTHALNQNAHIKIIREEIFDIPEGPTIIASGPLTSKNLSHTLQKLTKEEHLYFFDALSPIVEAASVDMNIAFKASRYGVGEKEGGDYINCPLNKEEYQNFVQELLKAERIPLKDFEKNIEHIPPPLVGGAIYFEGCLPVEVLASRGERSLAFGPMKPVGLDDPRTGRWPYAVVQLRQDNVAASLYNLVGFQTNLKYPEQERIFRMIPGLKNAEFVRFGQMHRNTFLNSPKVLRPTLQFKERDNLFFAGQITGVEGYMGNIATGLLAGINLALVMKNLEAFILPQTTMLGALCHYITHADSKHFQPMKANMGILKPLDVLEKDKKKKNEELALKSKQALQKLIGIALHV